jgi:putative transposase
MQQGIEFFTATCLNWQPLLRTKQRKQIVLDSLTFLVSEKRIWLYGYVIMPNHILILWAKRADWLDKNVQQHFTKFTAQQLKFSLQNTPTELETYKSTQNDRQYQFWERRPHIATMYNRAVLEQKLDYIHDNPVKAGLSDLPETMSFHQLDFIFGTNRVI